MASPPKHIDLGSLSRDSSRPGMTSPRGLPSPRMMHGDVPPQLSPLDAFAAHGRMLAKQLDDSAKSGKRLSRLPPLTIASSFAPSPNPGLHRSASADNEKDLVEPSGRAKTGTRTQLATPEERPISYYPRMSGLPPEPSEQEVKDLVNSLEERGRSRRPAETDSYFANAVEESPIDWRPTEQRQDWPVESEISAKKSHSTGDTHTHFKQPPTPRSFNRPGPEPSRSYDSNTLAIPKHPRGHSGSSVRSVPPESSDDEIAGSLGASFTSLRREPSASSGFSYSTPPRSPFIHEPARSPSVGSEYSVGSTNRAPRNTLNFSRPLSRASRPSVDNPPRHPLSDHTNATPYVDETVHTPVSLMSEDSPELMSDGTAAVPSYIYSRFSLPRGRVLQRNSLLHMEEPNHQFKWEQPSLPYSNVQPLSPDLVNRPPSPPQEAPRPSSAAATARRDESLGIPRASHDAPRRSHDTARPTGRTSPHLIKPKKSNKPTKSPRVPPPQEAASPRPATSKSSREKSSREITPEDHLAIGIKCHEEGSVHESTYHLRLAAKANHPTAMLLYALACRHGWGMRPNPKEAIQWLRNAMDSASLEVADDQDGTQSGGQKTKPGDVVEKRERRAQFALSIYELGISHMNGWGIEQDKALALRCFEIAGAWGDGDALAEAGYCYAQGVGCKKDLKKAARFYREAEKKGMSMVGNSWIYKPKYMDDDESSKKEKDDGGREGRAAAPSGSSPEKKQQSRNKSRTRSIFARKKTVTQGST